MPSVQNHLIERLPKQDRIKLLALCEPVNLTFGSILCEPTLSSQFAYFPLSGFISRLAMMDGKPLLEVGMVGREGMLGIELALGVPVTPLYAVVQGEGIALRIEYQAFQSALNQSKALQSTVNHYLYVLMIQLASTAACLHFHKIAPRLARWLLMSHDRVQADQFHITHEFLAYMLGVRRVGITLAANNLQRKAIIQYHRGEIIILNRKKLEAASCSCYVADQTIYQQFLH